VIVVLWYWRQHPMILVENMEGSMIFRNQVVVDQDKTLAAKQVVESTTIMMGRHAMMHLGLLCVLIVMFTSSNAVITMKMAIVVVVVVIHVGETEAKEMAIDVDLVVEEEVIITAGELVVSIQRVEAIATKITAIMMTITHLGEYRWSQLQQMMARLRIGSLE